MNRPPATRGLRHLALLVHSQNYAATITFYTTLLGMKIEWQPDHNSLYLSSGQDVLALHRTQHSACAHQKLDHFGFIVDAIDHVDNWYRFLISHRVPISQLPETHRDGAYGFYCLDPDGNQVEMIYYPPLSRYK